MKQLSRWLWVLPLHLLFFLSFLVQSDITNINPGWENVQLNWLDLRHDQPGALLVSGQEAWHPTNINFFQCEFFGYNVLNSLMWNANSSRHFLNSQSSIIHHQLVPTINVFLDASTRRLLIYNALYPLLKILQPTVLHGFLATSEGALSPNVLTISIWTCVGVNFLKCNTQFCPISTLFTTFKFQISGKMAKHFDTCKILVHLHIQRVVLHVYQIPQTSFMVRLKTF